jgi:type II secretory pathway pseudopilin PulG
MTHSHPMPERDQRRSGRADEDQSIVRRPMSSRSSGFTMVEVALCLAIVAFAMVAIMGVLPAGMQVQRENREETLINFDGNTLMEAIRGGSLAASNIADRIEWIEVNSSRGGRVRFSNSPPNLYLSPETVVGLLSTPKYIYDRPRNQWITNRVFAKIHPQGGSVADKLPAYAEGVSQISTKAKALREMSFSYRLTSEIIPFGLGPGELTGTNGMSATDLALRTNRMYQAWQMTNNTYALALHLQWPMRPSDIPGNSAQTFRAINPAFLSVSSNVLIQSNVRMNLYYFQPQNYQRMP